MLPAARAGASFPPVWRGGQLKGEDSAADAEGLVEDCAVHGSAVVEFGGEFVAETAEVAEGEVEELAVEHLNIDGMDWQMKTSCLTRRIILTALQPFTRIRS